MNSRLFLLALAAATAACASSSQPREAPAGPPPEGGFGFVGGPPPSIPPLLAERERLGLTSGQVNALDSVARDWRVGNDSLTTRLRAEFSRQGNRAGGRGGGFQLDSTSRRIAEAIADNNRLATDAVALILTPAQREQVCQIQPPRREGMGGRPQGDDRRPGGGGMGGRGGGGRGRMGGRGPGGRSGMAGDSLRGGFTRGWPWCGANRPAADSARS